MAGSEQRPTDEVLGHGNKAPEDRRRAGWHRQPRRIPTSRFPRGTVWLQG
jgi:hypothetical protein